MSSTDSAGRTPLHYAAVDGDINQAGDLIAQGLDVNLADQRGYTPLHFAAQSNAHEIVGLLLDNGADIDAQTVFGASPLMIALTRSAGKVETVRLLRDRGANLALPNNAGITPEQYARRVTNHDLVSVLFTDDPPR